MHVEIPTIRVISMHLDIVSKKKRVKCKYVTQKDKIRTYLNMD